MEKPGTILLFSYGSLRDAPVQMACFGRLLEGEADRISGYMKSWIEILDPAAGVDAGRSRVYPILDPTGNADDAVAGCVFELTGAELASADAYEGAEYSRVRVRLASDRDAWVYIRA